jgi:hypothetical protein
VLELIPQPRKVRAGEGRVFVSRLILETFPEPFSDYQTTFSRCLGKIVGPGEALPLKVRVSVMPGPEQAYELNIDGTGVDILATNPLGALYAARTLIDIWDQASPHLPALSILDSPTYPIRGVFVESNRGADLMGFEDWCSFIDALAQLKFNYVGISIYGCWDLRHDGERSEFLFVPLRDFPQLHTPQRIRTWDPGGGQEVSYEYRPKMFEENFFGRVVRYARESGVTIVPLFGGPGHSSLLPRLLPELSAVDEAGNPVGYGYCVTREGPRRLLRAVFRSLIEQHLLPNGITLLGCQGDEFYPILNLDPEDPLKSVSPYCRCEGCRQLTPGQLLTEYFSLVGGLLSTHGIRMFHWQDSLVREGVLEEYADRVDAEGIPKPVVSWWKYNDPIPQVPETAFETWVTPTPGLIGSLFYQDFALNIEGWLREGQRARAQGVFAYSSPDPAYHKNYACLADLAWNLEASGGAGGFKRRWARYVAPGAPTRAEYAYAVGESVLASYPLMTYILDRLLPYFSTSPKGVTRFPDDLVRPFSASIPTMTSVLRQVRDTLRESMRLLPETRGLGWWPNPHAQWETELLRISEHADIFLGLITLARRLNAESVADLEPEIASLERQGEQFLRRLARGKADYQAPGVLREHWYLISELRSSLLRLAADEERLPAPRDSWQAWLF